MDPMCTEVVNGPCLSLHWKEELAVDSGNPLLVIPVLSGHASIVGPKAVSSELDLGETLTPTGGI